MIRDGELVYEHVPSPLLHWELQNVTINAIAIALLTTVLSYQATSLLYDVCLGLKRKNVQSIRDIHVLLLIRQASVVSVFDAIARKDWFTKFRYRLGRNAFIRREEKRVPIPVVGKLLFLLLAAPVLNILSIALTLETERDVSFADSGFGGMVLGVNRDFEVVTAEPYAQDCGLAKFNIVQGDQPVSKVSVCTVVSEERVLSLSDSPNARIAIAIIVGTKLVISVSIHDWQFQAATRATLETPDGPFFIESQLGNDSRDAVIEKGLEMIAKECGLPDATLVVPLEQMDHHGLEVRASMEIQCPTAMEPKESARKIIGILGGLTTLVPARRFSIVNQTELYDDSNVAVEDPPFFQADGEVFLTRRRRILSLPILGIVATLTILLRALTGVFCNNDIKDGLEEVLKNRLGVKSCQSLMRTGTRRVTIDVNRCGLKEPYDVIRMGYDDVVGNGKDTKWAETDEVSL